MSLQPLLKPLLYPLLPVLSLLLTVSSCSLLDKMRETNERLYLQERLESLEASAAEAPSVPGKLTPYPILSEDAAEASELLSLASRLHRGPDLIRLYRLLGRGDLLIRYASNSDTLLLAEGFLLSGNAFEALRLLQNRPESPLYPFALLASGDTLSAFRSGERLLSEKGELSRPVKLRLARLLADLRPGDEALLDRVEAYALSEEERLYTSLRRGLLSRMPSDEMLTEAASKAVAGRFATGWNVPILQSLLPALLAREKYVLLYDVWSALPADGQAVYPYMMLSSLSKEITLLRDYESASEASSYGGANASEEIGSFRERYGDVPLVPNWGMIYLSGGPATSPAKPSKELYKETKALLRALLVPLGK